MSFKADSAKAVYDFIAEEIEKPVEIPDFEEDESFPNLESIKGKVYQLDAGSF